MAIKRIDLKVSGSNSRARCGAANRICGFGSVELLAEFLRQQLVAGAGSFFFFYIWCVQFWGASGVRQEAQQPTSQ